MARNCGLLKIDGHIHLKQMRSGIGQMRFGQYGESREAWLNLSRPKDGQPALPTTAHVESCCGVL